MGTIYHNDIEYGGGGSIPIASASQLGGIKVGDNLSIDANGVLSASSGIPTHPLFIATLGPNSDGYIRLDFRTTRVTINDNAGEITFTLNAEKRQQVKEFYNLPDTFSAYSTRIYVPIQLIKYTSDWTTTGLRAFDTYLNITNYSISNIELTMDYVRFGSEAQYIDGVNLFKYQIYVPSNS